MHISKYKIYLILFLTFSFASLSYNAVFAEDLSSSIHSLIQPATQSQVVDAASFLTLKNQFKIIGFLTVISLIPFGVMMMTSFTRITIVFQFLRQALGSAQIPSNQIIIGLSLILTGFIMQPVIKEIQTEAFTPYLRGELKNLPAIKSGSATEEAVLFQRAWQPLRKFLLSHIREKDLELFVDIAHVHFSLNEDGLIEENGDHAFIQQDIDQVPWSCIIPAFMLSELRTAFMMGFLLFLPFLIIDMVVASVLMSMGMMMLPPIMVSTPFKLLLFIMIDGWRIVVFQMVKGYQ